MKRREFIKDTALLTAAGITAAGYVYASPSILTPRRTKPVTEKGELLFKPYIVQQGKGPHLGMIKSFKGLGEDDWNFPSWAFASDDQWDAFYSNIFVDNDGVKISDTEGRNKFGINVRWNVEGFGYIYMTADNEGNYYELPSKANIKRLNLNYELAKSRAAANRNRYNEFIKDGYLPSRDVKSFLDLSEEYLNDAHKISSDEFKRAGLSQKSLYYSMWGGEKLELDKAWFDIGRMPFRNGFYMGCDSEDWRDMDKDLFMDLFTDVFDYATITYYLYGFQPDEGQYNFDIKDPKFRELRKRGVAVEGRPLFWADDCCCPPWLTSKSYPEILKYVEKFTRDMVSHYGSEMYAWEIINEAHDHGNVLKLSPEQMVEIAKLIAEVAKDTNPGVHRLINNCCLQADYVQIVNWDEYPREYKVITPHQFIKMCHEAGVEFTITGQQLYYQYTNRDLADTIRMVERLQKYGRPVQITEIGTTSGPNKRTIDSGSLMFENHPYSWHGRWDENLQADWLEQIYTIHYSKPWIEAINWYDFVDHFSFIENGGLLSDPQGIKKFAYEKMKNLKSKWKTSAKK
ncbi:MAG: endo-1,4-beta-xylanase [Melioribacteraceae bacterium]|nr:endo-1,4-beta-xylanase [Melioribacteraceae bacterium]